MTPISIVVTPPFRLVMLKNKLFNVLSTSEKRAKEPLYSMIKKNKKPNKIRAA